jgi:hypothetical protein
MAQRKKWDPERMKAAIEAMTNKEMGSYTASKVFNVPQTTLQRYPKDREKSPNEAMKTKLGRKQVLPREEENDLVEHCLLMKRKILQLQTICVSLTNGIRNQFWKRNEKAGRKRFKNVLHRHPEISVRTPEGLSLSRARGFTHESVTQYL